MSWDNFVFTIYPYLVLFSETSFALCKVLRHCYFDFWIKAFFPYHLLPYLHRYLDKFETRWKWRKSCHKKGILFRGSEGGRGWSFSILFNVHRSHDACENWNVTLSSLVFFSPPFFSCFSITRSMLIAFDLQPFSRELQEEDLYVDLFLILIYVRNKRCFLR